MKIKKLHFVTLSIFVVIFFYMIYRYALESKNIEYVSNNIDKNKSEEADTEKSELNVLFAGDIMFDRYIRKQINKYTKEVEDREGIDRNILGTKDFVEKYLNNLSEINRKYHYVVANLEGPITENKSKSLNDDGSYGKDLFFTFPTSSVNILKLLNIKVVSLANNHTDNFYHKGYEDTKKFLTSGDIKYFGNPYNNNLNIDKNNFEKESLSEIVCEKNICIAYVGYHQFTKNNSLELITKEIERIKDGNNHTDFILVMPHWGVEYEKTSGRIQKEYAHAWIDAGADFVVGAHPHVIQESEIYKDKYIYYSLGNYIFDQWFSVDVQNGKALDVTFKKECENNSENLKEKSCKKEIKINKELKIFIDRNGVKYVL